MIRTLVRRAVVAGVVGGAALGASLAVPSSSALAASTAPKVITLTNASSGSTVLALKGDIVKVKLSATKGIHWTEASVVPGGTVSPLVLTSGHVTSTGSSLTVFKVVGYGTAELEAIGTPPCTGATCPTYVILWEATVSVPVVDPPTA